MRSRRTKQFPMCVLLRRNSHLLRKCPNTVNIIHVSLEPPPLDAKRGRRYEQHRMIKLKELHVERYSNVRKGTNADTGASHMHPCLLRGSRARHQCLLSCSFPYCCQQVRARVSAGLSVSLNATASNQYFAFMLPLTSELINSSRTKTENVTEMRRRTQPSCSEKEKEKENTE